MHLADRFQQDVPSTTGSQTVRRISDFQVSHAGEHSTD
jgi:hypothetical protein